MSQGNTHFSFLLIFSLISPKDAESQACPSCISSSPVYGTNFPAVVIEALPSIAYIEEVRADFESAITDAPLTIGSYADTYFPVLAPEFFNLAIFEPFEYKPFEPWRPWNIFPKFCTTDYEELKCVGLHSDTDTLWAIVEIKEKSGYQSGPCGSGTNEYVTFWIDWNDDGDFDDPNEFIGQRLISVFNIGSNLRCGGLCENSSIYYAISLPITNPERKCCASPYIVKVRAILSAFGPHLDPYTCPMYGNYIDRLVQIKPETKSFCIDPNFPSFDWARPRQSMVKF